VQDITPRYAPDLLLEKTFVSYTHTPWGTGSIPRSGFIAMSLVNLLPQEREVTGHPAKGPEPEHTYTPSNEIYDDTILNNLYAEKDEEVRSGEAQTKQPKMDAPMLPEKSSLRASRLLDLNMKFGGSVQSTELSQATPHDIYLSSEEDASSSAEDFDFSDYDYESGSEDPQSPRRVSHEVTARVVSVVFMGKPSIIDLPISRRSASPNSMEARRRASTISSVSPTLQGSVTQTESATSSIYQQSPRKSSLVSSFLSKKKPPFLTIDPYANGSTYSLDTTSRPETEDSTGLKTPRTPTTMLKNMSRTLSLVRKRSRPLLNTNISAAAPPAVQEYGTESPAPALGSPAIAGKGPLSASPLSPLPSPPVTYNDIIKAAKKNSMMAPLQLESSPITPTGGISRRGILSGLAARRRSVKLTGKVL
jgi:hypothetical protein